MFSFLSRFAITKPVAPQAPITKLRLVEAERVNDNPPLNLSGLKQQSTVKVSLAACDAMSVCLLAAEDLGWSILSADASEIVCRPASAGSKDKSPTLALRVNVMFGGSGESMVKVTGYTSETGAIHPALLKRRLDLFTAQAEELAIRQQQAEWVGQFSAKRVR